MSKPDVNLSVAVATDAGLVVPIVRRAQELTFGELAARLREVAERARSGSLTQEDVSGGTITVSNLAMYGIETGTRSSPRRKRQPSSAGRSSTDRWP